MGMRKAGWAIVFYIMFFMSMLGLGGVIPLCFAPGETAIGITALFVIFCIIAYHNSSKKVKRNFFKHLVKGDAFEISADYGAREERRAMGKPKQKKIITGKDRLIEIWKKAKMEWILYDDCQLKVDKGKEYHIEKWNYQDQVHVFLINKFLLFKKSRLVCLLTLAERKGEKDIITFGWNVSKEEIRDFFQYLIEQTQRYKKTEQYVEDEITEYEKL